MTDLTTKYPPGTLIALPAELVNGLAQYLSHCSESAHDEPEDPAHALAKAIDTAYASPILPRRTETFAATSPTFLDVAYFAATVAEEAVVANDLGILSSPSATTTSVLGALFGETELLPEVSEVLLPRITNGDYDGLRWDLEEGKLVLLIPGSGKVMSALTQKSPTCPLSTDFSWIPEAQQEGTPQ